MTKTDKAVRLSAVELIAEAGSLTAALALAERVRAEMRADGITAAVRFYGRVVARLQTMIVNDRAGLSELAAWD
jgi:hypothetical protein